MSGDHFLNLQAGCIVNGRYEVVKCLGAGSMGMVYACRHRELAGHIVAMKVLFSEVARDDVAAARFRNEIVASYGVSHPNVVRAYEYFRDGDLIAFTMEYIGGGDLADRIAADEDISIEEVVKMLCQITSGVQAIHEAGIIHRDLKPENILITTQGNIKITDFGIARMGTGTKLTEHGGVVGTIDYVSPEYLERGQVDARSDIYAMGVIVYEMITGEPPFRGKSVIETMTMRLRSDPEPVHHLRLDCPVALSNIVLKAMARDPEERYQSAKEMLEDVESLKESLSISDSERKGLSNDDALHLTFAGSKKKVKKTGKHGTVSSDKTAKEINLQEGIKQLWTSNNSGTSVSKSEDTAIEEDYSELDNDYLIDDYYMRPLESVLKSNDFTNEDPWSSDSDNDSYGVAISHSSLSAQRIQELSNDIHQYGNSVLKIVLKYTLVIIVGFCFGLWFFMHFYPEQVGLG